MKYYLDRLEVIKALNEAQIEYDENYKGLGRAKEIIDSLPTIDLVAGLEKILENISISYNDDDSSQKQDPMAIFETLVKELNNDV